MGPEQAGQLSQLLCGLGAFAAFSVRPLSRWRESRTSIAPTFLGRLGWFPMPHRPARITSLSRLASGMPEIPSTPDPLTGFGRHWSSVCARYERLPKIGGYHLRDQDCELYEPDGGISELIRCMDKVNELTTEIARHGVGQAIAVELGLRFSHRDGVEKPELFLQGLGRAKDKSERKKVAEAIREWADGDSVAAHYGFGMKLFCSEDFRKNGAGHSVLDHDNRQWLSHEVWNWVCNTGRARTEGKRMSQLPTAITLALIMGVCSASISWAQNGVQVPAQQRELTRILSKYNDLHEALRTTSSEIRLIRNFGRNFARRYRGARYPVGSVR